MGYKAELNTEKETLKFENFLIETVDYEYIRGRICLKMSMINEDNKLNEDYIKLIKMVRKERYERGWLNLKVKVTAKEKILREYEIKSGRVEKLFEMKKTSEKKGRFKLIIKEAIFNDNNDYDEQEEYSIRIMPDDYSDMILNGLNYTYDRIGYEDLERTIQSVKSRQNKFNYYFTIRDNEKSITGKILLNLSQIESIKYESSNFGENISNHIKLGLKKIYNEEKFKEKVGKIYLNGTYISYSTNKNIDMQKIELKPKQTLAEEKMIEEERQEKERQERIAEEKRLAEEERTLKNLDRAVAIKKALDIAADSLEEYRKEIIEGKRKIETLDGEMFKAEKISIVLDITQLGKESERHHFAYNGIWKYNPSIIDKEEMEEVIKKTGKEINSLFFETEHLKKLTKEHINKIYNLRQDFYKRKNVSLDELEEELEKTNKMINNTKEQAEKAARLSGNVDKYIRPNGEYSFQSNWSVENCAEIWAVRDAILNGSKIENLVMRTVSFKKGDYVEPCKNCKITFKEFLDEGRLLKNKKELGVNNDKQRVI